MTNHALSCTAHLFSWIHMLCSLWCLLIRLVLAKSSHTPKVHHLIMFIVGDNSLLEFGLLFWNCWRTALMLLASHWRGALEKHLFVCVHLSLSFALSGANTFAGVAIWWRPEACASIESTRRLSEVFCFGLLLSWRKFRVLCCKDMGWWLRTWLSCWNHNVIWLSISSEVFPLSFCWRLSCVLRWTIFLHNIARIRTILAWLTHTCLESKLVQLLLLRFFLLLVVQLQSQFLDFKFSLLLSAMGVALLSR